MIMQWILCLLLSLVVGVYAQDDEEVSEPLNNTYHENLNSLQEDIVSRGSSIDRPVKDTNTVTLIQVEVMIDHIESIDENRQTIALHGHMYQSWNDDKHSWDPKEFVDVKDTLIRSWYLWTPRLVLVNSAKGASSWSDFDRYTMIKLQYYGRATYLQPFSLKATCDMNFQDYPYDTQECSLLFRPPGPMSETELKTYYAPLMKLSWQGDYDSGGTVKTRTSGWTLLPPASNIIYETHEIQNYTTSLVRPKLLEMRKVTTSKYKFTIRLRRYAPYFGITIVLPTVLCSLMTMTSFVLPKHKEAVYILLINIFMQMIFTTDLLLKLPPGIGSTPKIGASTVGSFLDASSSFGAPRNVVG